MKREGMGQARQTVTHQKNMDCVLTLLENRLYWGIALTHRKAAAMFRTIIFTATILTTLFAIQADPGAAANLASLAAACILWPASSLAFVTLFDA